MGFYELHCNALPQNHMELALFVIHVFQSEHCRIESFVVGLTGKSSGIFPALGSIPVILENDKVV